MAVEVAPGVIALTSPFPDEPRMTVNAYVLEGPDGWILVDTGWDADEALRLLEDHLATRGADWSVIDLVLVTHLHPDHFGLIWLTRERGNARLAYHLLESQFMQPRYTRFEEWEQQMFAWDRVNGWPADAFPRSPSVASVLEKFKAPKPDVELMGDEVFENGRHRLRAVWTPGHTPGHLCFFEERNGLLFTGDHLLPTISPNVSLQSQGMGSPLADFMDSLKLVRELPVAEMMPGHGPSSTDVVGRIDQLMEHHEHRLHEILTAVGRREEQDATTAFQIASRIHWTKRELPFDALSPHHRRLALGETLSHLEVLRGRGLIRRQALPGRIVYGRVE
jgi:glyoxylase-like metal-dependent hydrolase (beta-lactamase superfamily II)